MIITVSEYLHQSVCLSVCLPACLTVCLSICLSICLIARACLDVSVYRAAAVEFSLSKTVSIFAHRAAVMAERTLYAANRLADTHQRYSVTL